MKCKYCGEEAIHICLMPELDAARAQCDQARRERDEAVEVLRELVKAVGKVKIHPLQSPEPLEHARDVHDRARAIVAKYRRAEAEG